MIHTTRVVALLALMSAATFAQQPVQRAQESASGGTAGLLNRASGQTGSYPICGSHLLAAQEQALAEYASAHPEVATSLAKTGSWGFTVGSTHAWYAHDYSSGADYQTNSTCYAVGKHCYIFVEDSMWTTGRVDQAIVDSVRDAFDSRVPADSSKGVYQMDVNAFGNPPDVDGDSLIIILILNIRDGYTGSGGYVTGYFYNLNEYNYSGSNHAEIYFLDANPLDLQTSDGLTIGMSTTAHEFQHMIHWNYHKSQMTFVNEGCSLVAEVNCGYDIYSQSYYNAEPNHYLFDWRSSDNTAVLNDYSRAARFFTYLRDQFTMSIFKNIVQSSPTGVAGLSYALGLTGTGRSFLNVFADWTVANALNDTTVDARYGYEYPGLTKPTATVEVNPNATISDLKISPLGTSYVKFTGGSNLSVTVTGTGGKLVTKALEFGTINNVADLTSGTAFSESGFGSTYSATTIAMTDTSSTDSVSIALKATGTFSGSLVMAYDSTAPTGYLALKAGDTVCVVFDAVSGGRLDSVRVGLRRVGSITGGVWRYGTSRAPLGTALAVPITATGTDSITYPYPDPYTNWGTVDLHSLGISTSSQFVVGFVCSGDSTTKQRVMVTESPVSSGIHSYTYYNEASTPAWYYLTTSDAGDSVYDYLIRAYVSFPSDTTTDTSSTTTTLTVYPGDTNNDGIVDVRDVLPIGRYYGTTGASRSGASLTWSAQTATAWTTAAATYADCDGNGTVNASDILGVIDNWFQSTSSSSVTSVNRQSVCEQILESIDASTSNAGLKAVRQAVVQYLETEIGVTYAYALNQNFPNPFNPSTTIRFTVPELNNQVRLTIYDVLGEVVWEKVLTSVEAGSHDIVWNGQNSAGKKVGSGAYFYRLSADHFSSVRHMVLLK